MKFRKNDTIQNIATTAKFQVLGTPDRFLITPGMDPAYALRALHKPGLILIVEQKECENHCDIVDITVH